MSIWQPGPRPEWVLALNQISHPEWVELDADQLVEEAQARSGLSDFGSELFWEPYRIFVDALNDEAQLHTLGRLIVRDDLLNSLTIRLELTDWRKRHPETLILSTQTGFSRNYFRSPYMGYERSRELYFPVEHKSNKYRTKEMVLGVTIDGQHKAYPFKELRKQGLANFVDQFAGERLTISVNVQILNRWFPRSRARW